MVTGIFCPIQGQNVSLRRWAVTCYGTIERLLLKQTSLCPRLPRDDPFRHTTAPAVTSSTFRHCFGSLRRTPDVGTSGGGVTPLKAFLLPA